MSGELRFDGIPWPLDGRQSNVFRLAVALSVGFHIVVILTSPYWQTRPTPVEHVVQVDIADVPPAELPPIPQVKAPEKVREPAPRVAAREPEPREATAPAQPAVPPPPTREMIREKVSTVGLAKMLTGKPGDPRGLPGLKDMPIPSPGPRAVSQGKPSAGDFRPPGEPVLPKGNGPTITNQVAAAPRSSTALSSQVFRTDSGLDAEISGGIDDQSRTTGAINARVKEYASGIRGAYNRELLKRPDISGKITVGFVILADGSVDSVEIRQSSVGWPDLDEAVRKRIRFWKFPKSNGAPVRVTFPFVFQPEM